MPPSHQTTHPIPPACLQLLRGTERYVDSLRIEMLPGCSHWAQQHQPQEVNRLMAEFLGGQAPPGCKK